MRSDEATAAYQRGYSDGIAEASRTVAEFYLALKQEDERIVSDLRSVQAVTQQMILARLAPLQDAIKELEP